MEDTAKFYGADEKIKDAPKSNLENQVVESKKGTNMFKKFKNIKSNVTGKKNLKGFGVTGLVFLGVAAVVAVFLYILLIKPAYALFSTANVLKRDSSLIGESLANRDLVALNEALDKTERDLEKLRSEKDKKFGWAKNLGLFKAKEFYSDSEKFINAGLYAVDALREASVVVTPFADAVGLKISEEQEVVETEGFMEAFQSWISVMPEVADQMDTVIEMVAKIGDELKSINTSKYPKKIGKVQVRASVEFIKNTLSDADEYAPDIKKAFQVVPGVLAVGTPTKRYMIIMQNDKELRPTGGFMTNYATFKVTNGLLDSDFTSKDMYSIDYSLDYIDATYDFPDAPPAYMKYLKVEHWYARDMNSQGDFVNSMDQFMTFYNLAGRINPWEIKPVDGIFAIDTHVISELLEATGPVTVNGITYTKDNVVFELERIASLELSEQINRKKVLGDLMESMLINVFESDSNLWPKLIEKAADLATRKHVLIYLFDEEAQILVEKYGLGGRITDPVDGDYSYIVSTNLGGDKTNWFTDKEVKHTLERNGDRWMRTVNIKYTYNQPDESFAAFVRGFRDWVRVYTPLGSELISVDGSEDEEMNMTGEERGKNWFSGWINLAPGESKELTFKYYLPAELELTDNYVLNIQKQPGIESEKHTVMYGSKTEEVNLSKDVKVTLGL
ncbi:DUF4012 domain-containing protein [Patescibacteria group bacterium]